MDNRLLTRTDWDADSYLEAGLRGDFGDTRVELIDGEVYEVASTGHPHWLAEVQIRTLLTVALDRRVWTVGGQSTVKLGIRDVPEPDVFVLRGRARSFDDLPKAADLTVVIEVGDTSRDFDRRRKLPRYALAGVPEVWLVDVPDRFVEVCTLPVGEAYLARRRYEDTERVPFTVDGAELAVIDVAEILV